MLFSFFVLRLCPFDISVGAGAFVIGHNQNSSLLSYLFISFSFLCGRRRVTVARYRMIRLLLMTVVSNFADQDEIWYVYKSWIELNCALHCPYWENWVSSSKLSSPASEKHINQNNSYILSFPTNCSNTWIHIHMSSVGLYKGHISLDFRENWICLKRNESKFYWQSKFLLSLFHCRSFCVIAVHLSSELSLTCPW